MKKEGTLPGEREYDNYGEDEEGNNTGESAEGRRKLHHDSGRDLRKND